MSHREFHVMTTEFVEDRQTTRYECPQCQRCLEDGPEGVRLINKGDQTASHRGGNIFGLQQEVEPQPKEQPTLH